MATRSSTFGEVIPQAPLPPRTEDANRWEHTRLRERLMAGTWRADLELALDRHMGRSRSHGAGPPDMSSNILRSVSVQLAVLYDRPPTVSHALEAAAPLIGDGGELRTAGLWQLMGGLQRDTIAFNEDLLGISVSASGAPQFVPVSPGMVIAESEPDAPDVPVAIRWLRLRRHPRSGQLAWTWEIWDPRVPVFRIVSADGQEERDLTSVYVTDSDGAPVAGPLEGEDYPWWWTEDERRPLLPFVLYHSSRSPHLWRPFEGIEVVEGTLSAAVGWSFWFHCLRDASWPQRVAVNCRPVGSAIEETDDSPREGIVTDPSTVMLLESDEETPGQPMVTQWQASSDPKLLGECLLQYETRIAEFAGISPSDIQRMGGTAKSGYAISISQAGKREAQRRYEPQFRRGDLEAVAKVAAMVNTATGSTYPESGYEIVYAAVPKSPQELEAERKHVLELLEAGLIDRAQALQTLNPGISRDEALRRLDTIRRVNLSTTSAA